MKALIDRESLLGAFNLVSGLVPARSPMAVLRNVKLQVGEGGGASLLATDLEVWIRRSVPGVRPDRPGEVLLPAAKLGSILRACEDGELLVEVDGEHVRVRGDGSNFKLPFEDPGTYPEAAAFEAEAYHVVSAGDLRKLIRRTVFATDPASAVSYALSGVLLEKKAGTIGMAGTDGRRLAAMSAPAEMVGEPSLADRPVVPVKALKLIDRSLGADDSPVHVATDASRAMVRTDGSEIVARLVEGRYPRYENAMPSGWKARATATVGMVRQAVEKAAIATSEESRGVDFRFAGGSLRLAAQASDVAAAEVEVPVEVQGGPVEITFDVRYLADALKALDEDDEIVAELEDRKSPAVMRTADGYTYVVMPLIDES